MEEDFKTRASSETRVKNKQRTRKVDAQKYKKDTLDLNVYKTIIVYHSTISFMLFFFPFTGGDKNIYILKGLLIIIYKLFSAWLKTTVSLKLD